MAGFVCSDNENYRDLEDWRDHMPCPGTDKEQLAALREKYKACQEVVLAACKWRDCEVETEEELNALLAIVLAVDNYRKVFNV